MDPGEGLNQGGLAGPVVAEQARDLPGPDLHGDAFERDDVPEVLRDASRFHEWCVARHHLASEARLRMKLLNTTAMSSMTPTKTRNQSVLTPMKKMPCCTIPKMSAPKTAPTTEPYPPVSNTPPMTEAAMACSSRSSPRRTSADPASSTWMVASSAAERAVHMNSVIFTRFTGTPTLRAAFASPPAPKIQFPNVVLCNTHVPSTASASHQMMVTEKGPIVPANSGVSGLFATPSPSPICVRPVNRRAKPMVRPRSAKSIPKVTMNEGSPVLITRYPLKNPTASATAKASSTAAASGQPYSVVVIAMIMPAAPTIEPTERSNSPAIISIATGTATMPSCAATSR